MSQFRTLRLLRETKIFEAEDAFFSDEFEGTRWHEPISEIVCSIAYYIHEFRLLLLCLLAIVAVREIRGIIPKDSQPRLHSDSGCHPKKAQLPVSPCSCCILHSDRRGSQDSRPLTTSIDDRDRRLLGISRHL